MLFGWVAQGWNVNELNTRKTCSAAGPRCVVGGGVWGVGMVVVVLVVVFSTQTLGFVGTDHGWDGNNGYVWCTVGF